MTSLVPVPSAFVTHKTSGEQRPAEWLEQTSDYKLLNASQRDGYAWGDMAVLCTGEYYFESSKEAPTGSAQVGALPNRIHRCGRHRAAVSGPVVAGVDERVLPA